MEIEKKTVYCADCGGVISSDFEISQYTMFCKCQKSKYPIGWYCPNCRKIHSPYSLTCDCMPAVINTTTANGAGYYNANINDTTQTPA